MELLLLLWIGCGVGAALIAGSKSRSALGWGVLGFLFGPIGLLGAAMISRDSASQERRAIRAGLQDGKLRRCPQCAEAIQAAATKCRFCGDAVTPEPRRGLLG